MCDYARYHEKEMESMDTKPIKCECSPVHSHGRIKKIVYKGSGIDWVGLKMMAMMHHSRGYE